MISDALKNELADALETYVKERGLTQVQLERLTGVNAAYLIQIRRRDFFVNSSGDSKTAIKDKYFKAIAETIDFPLKKTYWKTEATMQTREILGILGDARDNLEPAVIIGETGSGKSYTCELFRRKYPADTFIVRAGSSDTLKDLMSKVLAALNPPYKVVTRSAMVRQAAMLLERISLNEQKPMLIIDEAEYLNTFALCAWKELYDALDGVASLVLVGTDQLLTNLDRMRAKDRGGIPQLYRRIRWRIRRITPLDRSFKIFIKDYPMPVQKWLTANCDNYGEVNNVMTTVLREADRTGEELTVDFIKLVLGI